MATAKEKVTVALAPSVVRRAKQVVKQGTGGLLPLEKRDKGMQALLCRAREVNAVIVIPAGVLAQA